MEKREQCLVLIKPDGLVKSLTGNILTSLSETKLIIVGAKIVQVNRELAEQHYYKLQKTKSQEIYENTLEYIQGRFHTNRVLVMVYEGENAIGKIREIVGETNPETASSTSIRGRYGRIVTSTGVFENVVHASESFKEAKREIKLWFEPSELSSRIYPTEIKSTKRKVETWK